MTKTVKKNYLHDLLTYPSEQSRSSVEKLPRRSIGIRHYAAGAAHKNRDSENPHTLPSPPDNAVSWYHLVGMDDAQQLHQLLRPFAVHDLTVEDIFTRQQRPKIEDYGHYLFIATTVFAGQNLAADQIYLIIGKNFVITIQHKPLGLFTPITSRLDADCAAVCDKGAAFLAYMLLDRIIDDYFVALNMISARTEKLDQKLFSRHNSDILPRIHRLKRDAVRIRRALAPLRDGLNQMMRGDFPLMGAGIRVFVRDTCDHALQLSESLDTVRDTVQSMMDVYLSFQSNALNKQMRVLTSITIIFMPLTLIAGIYGMNFDVMPELHWRYGYFAVLALMAVLAIVMLRIFKRKDWL